MTDIYCGAKKVPKNKKLGTMKECVEAGKIMHWGIKKIDSKTMTILGAAKKRVSSGKLMVKVLGVRGKMRKVKGDISYEKDAKKKKELEKKLKELEKENKELSAQYVAAKKVEDNKVKTTTKKTSKKGSKK